jgi:hypothetical protein
MIATFDPVFGTDRISINTVNGLALLLLRRAHAPAVLAHGAKV